MENRRLDPDVTCAGGGNIVVGFVGRALKLPVAKSPGFAVVVAVLPLIAELSADFCQFSIFR